MNSVNLNGVINLIKPQNMTSHDVVAQVRKKLKIKKVGHTGTLDPMATGVLPVAVGNSTRIMDFLDYDIKGYRCSFALGLSSDTLDIWGNVKIAEANRKEISEKDIIECIKSMRGIIRQIPPKYSALKLNGKKLYEYARAGIEVDIKPREVYIKDITDIEVDRRNVLFGKEPESLECTVISFNVLCSKGTYIRSLCSHMGTKLGSDGVMIALNRFQSGVFKESGAITLDEFKNWDINRIDEIISPPCDAMASLGEIFISKEFEKIYLNGGKISPKNILLKREGTANRGEWVLQNNRDMISLYKLFTVKNASLEDRSFIGVCMIIDNGAIKPYKLMI